MPIATNPETGETIFLSPEGEWQPAKIATNPETKERLAFDGNSWVPLKAPEPSVGADVAKSAGIGLVKGGIGIAGLGGDVRETLASGADWVSRKFGGTPDVGPPQQSTVGQLLRGMEGLPLPGPAQYLTMPTSQKLQSAIESKTGEFYKPKTTAGEYAQTFGEFVPAVASPVRAGAKVLPEIARRVVTQAAIPSATSETAGQIAREVAPEYEGYARLAGGVGGGVAASKLEGAAARPGAVKSVPTARDISESAQSSYDQMRRLPFGMAAESPAQVANNIKTNLTAQGLLDVVAPKTYGVVEKLGLPKEKGKDIATISDVLAVRAALGKVRMGTDPVERMAAGRAIDAIDTYISNLGKPRAAIALSESATSGLSDAAVRDLKREVGGNIAALSKKATADYAAAKRSEKITDALERAANNAASAGTGANVANAIRQQIRPMLNDPKRKLAGFSKEEIAALRRVNRGTTAGNIARGLGTLAPTGVVSGALAPVIGAMLGSAAGPIGTVIGAGVAPVVGMIGRQISNATTARQAAYADALVRSRSPLAAGTRDPAELARLLANSAPWLRQAIQSGLLIRPQIPAPYGIDQPR